MKGHDFSTTSYGNWDSALAGSEQTCRGGKKRTSGAKARTHFQRFNGTSELVPFPFVENFELFCNLLWVGPGLREFRERYELLR